MTVGREICDNEWILKVEEIGRLIGKMFSDIRFFFPVGCEGALITFWVSFRSRKFDMENN